MKHLFRLPGYCVVVICALLVGLYATHRLQPWNDAKRYSLVSQQLLNGRGLRVPIVYFSDETKNNPDAAGTIAFLEQPPMISMLLAMLGGVGPGDLFPARVLNVSGLVIVALFCALITNRLVNTQCAQRNMRNSIRTTQHARRNTILGIVCGIAVAFAYPLLLVSRFWFSELIFTAFMVVCIWLLISARQSAKRGPCLFGAGIFAAAAIATRFAGVALIPVFLWNAVVSAKNKNAKRLITGTFISTVVPVFAVGVLLARNFVLSGTVRGFHQPDQKRPWYVAAYGILSKISGQLGIQKLFGDRLALILIGVAVLIAAVIFLNHKRSDIVRIFRAGFDLILVFIVISC